MFRSLTFPVLLFATIVVSGCSGSPLSPSALAAPLSVAPVAVVAVAVPLVPVVTPPVTPVVVDPIVPSVPVVILPAPDPAPPAPPVRTPVISPVYPITCEAPAFAIYRDTQWVCETWAGPPVAGPICPVGQHAILGETISCEIDAPVPMP